MFKKDTYLWAVSVFIVIHSVGVVGAYVLQLKLISV
jgi:hypothetical protein